MLARAFTPLVDGNSNNANWPLANKNSGNKTTLLGNDADIDKRVSAYLLVSGLLLGGFSTETLKLDDWQTGYEASVAENEALKETNNAQAQTIVKQAQKIMDLEAKLSALTLLLPGDAAAY